MSATQSKQIDNALSVLKKFAKAGMVGNKSTSMDAQKKKSSKKTSTKKGMTKKPSAGKSKKGGKK